MKYISTIVAAVLFLTGCATPQASRRIESSVSAVDYNSISSTYDRRPTFAEIHKISGKNVLELKMNSYGSRDIWIVFHQDHVDKYIAAIDKFTEWKKIASGRGEMISKEIVKLPAQPGATLIFTFHSVENARFLLQVTVGSTGLLGTIPIDRGMMFDSSELDSLKALLRTLPQEKIESTDSIYK